VHNRQILQTGIAFAGATVFNMPENPQTQQPNSPGENSEVADVRGADTVRRIRLKRSFRH